MTAHVLIVGSGAAGLTAALNLAATHKVAVIAKGALGEGATGWAQGGIAAVLEEGDSFEAHVRDTMTAGARPTTCSTTFSSLRPAPAAIEHLAELGVPFASGGDGQRWHLTREGGHSHRRIVHVADATGSAVQQALEKAAASHPNIRLIPDMVAIDLITGRHATHFSTSGAIHGLYAYNRRTKRVEALTARATILATGGPAASTSIRPRRAGRPATASPWRGGQAAACRTWNSCNSTRPASTTSRSRTS